MGAMGDEPLEYPRLVREALLDVPRRVLRRAAREGLPGEHHFYLSFRTDHPGVSLSPALKARHPQEMTIVLQHQYWDLAVGDEAFSVTLRFAGAAERLHVPFTALTAFADPAAEFGLRFDAPAEARAVRPGGDHDSREKTEAPAPASDEADRDPRRDNVIDIRAFRRGDETEPLG